MIALQGQISQRQLTGTLFRGGSVTTLTKEAIILALGYAPIDPAKISLGIASDGLIYIFVDGNPVGTGIPQGNTGDVYGYVDENNNIVLTGNLADGTYTVKYEMGNGDIVDIGDMVLDGNVYYSVTNTLTNCTSNNGAKTVVEGGSYSATITANSGCELSSVVVTMGGAFVAVTNGVINIASVTGDIVITAVAVEKKKYSVINSLTKCSNNNGTILVSEGGSYSAVISAEDGYELSSLVVTMGGVDVSASAVSGGNINITNVTGDIVITAVAEKVSNEYCSVELGLNYCIIDNDASQVVKGGSYSATVSAISGYQLSSVEVYMGGYNISSSVVSGNTINIASVTGGITIIATAVAGTPAKYYVLSHFTKCQNSNSATEVEAGSSYSATITPAVGYELVSLTVQMGDTYVPAPNGVINIASVTGDIVITAVAEKVSIVNQITASTDASGNPFNNGQGWKTGTRLSLSSGGETTASGYECTGFIPVKPKDVVRIKNIDLTDENATNFVCYDANRNPINGGAANYGHKLYTMFVTHGTESNGVYTATLVSSIHNALQSEDLAYIRIGSKEITADSILTVNQEIL